MSINTCGIGGNKLPVFATGPGLSRLEYESIVRLEMPQSIDSPKPLDFSSQQGRICGLCFYPRRFLYVNHFTVGE